MALCTESKGAMKILEKNQDKINWDYLSCNPSNAAKQLLKNKK